MNPPAQAARPPHHPASGAAPGTNARNSAVLPGMGAALTNRKVRGGTGNVGEDVTSEFDFEYGLSEFNKEEDKAKVLGQEVCGRFQKIHEIFLILAYSFALETCEKV